VAADALVILSKAASAVREARPFKPDLQAVLTPASVAIVGASDDIRKWGGSALRNLLDGGYQGKIYPVNPRGGVFFGIQAYASIADLPEAADLAAASVRWSFWLRDSPRPGRKGPPSSARSLR